MTIPKDEVMSGLKGLVEFVWLEEGPREKQEKRAVYKGDKESIGNDMAAHQADGVMRTVSDGGDAQAEGKAWREVFLRAILRRNEVRN